MNTLFQTDIFDAKKSSQEIVEIRNIIRNFSANFAHLAAPIRALSQIRFCKEFLGSLFFGDAVDNDIHEEPKNKLTTKFAAKDRICDSAISELREALINTPEIKQKYSNSSKKTFPTHFRKIILTAISDCRELKNHRQLSPPNLMKL